MNEIIHSQALLPTANSVAIAFGAALAAGQAHWPAAEPRAYVIERTEASYSEVAERILAASKHPHSSFVDQIAAMYSAFSQRQQLLGAEFEIAIFEDLESLYES